MITQMQLTFGYDSETVQTDIFFGASRRARPLHRPDWMHEGVGANLGEPHTLALGDGLLELRLRSQQGLPVCCLANWWNGAS
jgi:hypothetical protein